MDPRKVSYLRDNPYAAGLLNKATNSPNEMMIRCVATVHPVIPTSDLEMTTADNPPRGSHPEHRPFALKGNDRLDQPSIFRWELLVSERITDWDLLWHESWPNESSSVSLSGIWWRFWRKKQRNSKCMIVKQPVHGHMAVNLACVPQSNVDIPFFVESRLSMDESKAPHHLGLFEIGLHRPWVLFVDHKNTKKTSFHIIWLRQKHPKSQEIHWQGPFLKTSSG